MSQTAKTPAMPSAPRIAVKRAAKTVPAAAASAKAGINAAIDLFHRRWTMRILWELRSGPATFRALQSACADLSPTVLNTRLAELREANLVEHLPGEGYALTRWGDELLVAMGPLLQWAARWQRATAMR